MLLVRMAMIGFFSLTGKIELKNCVKANECLKMNWQKYAAYRDKRLMQLKTISMIQA